MGKCGCAFDREQLLNTSNVPTPISPSKATWIEIIESYIGGLLSMVIAFELIVGGILVLVDPPSGNVHIPKFYSIPLLACAVVFDGWLVMTVWAGLSAGQFPVGLWVALRQPTLPWALRPVVALVWVAHAVMLGYSAFAMHGVTQGMNRVGALPAGVEAVLMLLAFGMTFLCNIYILLVLQSLWPRARAMHVFWRMRFALDVLLTVGSYFALRGR
jgi:hypothetical protein